MNPETFSMTQVTPVVPQEPTPIVPQTLTQMNMEPAATLKPAAPQKFNNTLQFIQQNMPIVVSGGILFLLILILIIHHAFSKKIPTPKVEPAPIAEPVQVTASVPPAAPVVEQTSAALPTAEEMSAKKA